MKYLHLFNFLLLVVIFKYYFLDIKMPLRPQSTAVMYQKDENQIVLESIFNYGATVKCSDNTRKFYKFIYKNNFLIHFQVLKTASI